MRIISKHRDYYDSARAFGADPKLVYVRNNQLIEREDDRNGVLRILQPLVDLVDSAPTLGWRRSTGDSSLRTFLIGFCGRGYLRLKYAPPALTGREIEDEVVPEPPRYFSTPEEVFAFSEGRKRDKKDYPISPANIKSLRKDHPKSDWGHPKYAFNEKGWELWHQEHSLDISDEVFRELRAPVFLIRGHPERVELNPILLDWGFPQVLDPYTCFQEIAQFLGNNMATQMDGDENISDADRASMHGFGHRYAFRKEPTKKRK